jgi:hypothetical protein
MSPKLDPAIAEALSIDLSATIVKRHGSSEYVFLYPHVLSRLIITQQSKHLTHRSFTATFKITTTVNGKPKSFFMKTAKGKGAEAMFAGIFLFHSRISLSP